MGVIMKECSVIRCDLNKVIDKELEELYLPHIERAAAAGISSVTFPGIIKSIHRSRLRELGYRVTYSASEYATSIWGW